ncbi:MAG: imidazolonepropionase, partial [Cyclobacteriaceae bacterium]|nr:imidazolonepropionase [Cyclobacteriaceae bacterium]
MVHDILITNIKGLVQVRESPIQKVSGKEMSYLPVLQDAFLVIADGLIHRYGSMKDLPSDVIARQTIDATGCFVFPSFVDSHTHLVFANPR